MPTAYTIEDVKRAQDAFNIARAEAIDAYAHLEISLMFLLTDRIGGNQHHTRVILSRLHNTRSRNTIIQKIVDKDTDNRYRLFTNSLFKEISEADKFRNHLAHWHMCSFASLSLKTSEEKMFGLLPPGPTAGEPPRIYKSDIEEFRQKTLFLSQEAHDLAALLNPDQHRTADWPQSWRDRFLQSLSYPPPAGHPQFRTYKARPDPPRSSQA